MKLQVEHSAGRTAVLIVTDDMPFLVDSTTAAIASAGLDLALLAHPLVVVRRAALGKLLEVRPDIEPDEAGTGELVESWMRVEVGRLSDESAVLALRNDLQRVLTDVREAVEDWPRMRTQALSLADDLGLGDASRAGQGHHRLGRAAALARRRPLHLPRLPRVSPGGHPGRPTPDGERALSAVMGTGLGNLAP